MRECPGQPRPVRSAPSPAPSSHTLPLSGSVSLSPGSPVQMSPRAGKPSNALSVIAGGFPASKMESISRNQQTSRVGLVGVPRFRGLGETAFLV